MIADPARRAERELQAFVDGELPPDRHAAVVAAIARDPATAAAAARLLAERASFERLADRLLSRPVPERLARAALRPPAEPAGTTRAGGSRWRQLGYAVPVAAALSLAVVAAPWIRHSTGLWRVAGEPVVTAALEARDSWPRPVREMTFRGGAGASATALDDADRFVSDGLGEAARAPDLRRAGFVLDAAELYGGKAGRAVQLRYLDRNHRLFTVYVHPGPGPDRFRLLSRHRLQVCLWENEDVVTVMSGALPQPELFRLASMAYVALSL